MLLCTNLTNVLLQAERIIERIYTITQLPRVSLDNTTYVLEVLTPEVYIQTLWYSTWDNIIKCTVHISFIILSSSFFKANTVNAAKDWGLSQVPGRNGFTVKHCFGVSLSFTVVFSFILKTCLKSFYPCLISLLKGPMLKSTMVLMALHQ